jgi:hypothetical protein
MLRPGFFTFVLSIKDMLGWSWRQLSLRGCLAEYEPGTKWLDVEGFFE